MGIKSAKLNLVWDSRTNAKQLVSLSEVRFPSLHLCDCHGATLLQQHIIRRVVKGIFWVIIPPSSSPPPRLQGRVICTRIWNNWNSISWPLVPSQGWHLSCCVLEAEEQWHHQDFFFFFCFKILPQIVVSGSLHLSTCPEGKDKD